MSGHKTTHTQLERFKIIDTLLCDGNVIPFEFILTKLRELLRTERLSVSSLRRDLCYMRDELSAPIVYDKKNRGWKYTKKYKLPSQHFNEDESLYLYLIRQLISQHSPDDTLYNSFDELLEQITPSISSGNIAGDKNSVSLYERFFIPLRPKMIIDKEVAMNVFIAIKNNKIIDFDYYSKWEPDKKHRIILPYQLVIDEGSLYLYGASPEEKTNPRLFNLSKMHNVQILNAASFELPENFRFHEKEEQGRFGAFQYDDYFDFKIEFYGDARKIVREYLWSDNQLIEEDSKNNKTVISFTTSQWGPVKKWLLSFGPNARPLEPDWLVEEWKEDIKEMFKNIS